MHLKVVRTAQQMVLSLILSTASVQGQKIDLDGYKLSSENVGLVPVFGHNVRGHIRCGNAPLTTAKIDVIEARRNKRPLAPKTLVLHAESGEQGSFHVWVPRGDWTLIVRASCENQIFGLPFAEVRVGQAIEISSSTSNDSSREVAIDMQTRKMEVIKDGKVELAIAMGSDGYMQEKVSY
jgi:hypothetical protein